MSRYLSVGIDIGSLMTRVSIAETGKNKPGFKIIGSGEVESSGMRQGYVINQNEAIKSIQEAVALAEAEAGTSIKSAMVSVGGVGLESSTAHGSVIISRVDGEITKADIDKAIEVSEKSAHLTNKKIIHRFPLVFKIDNKKVLGDPQGMRGIKLEVETLFITSLDQHLENIINTVERAGIDVEDIVAAPLAASLVTLNKAQRTAGCVLANIGAETISIGVFENDYLISLGVFPLGSTDITNDIALGLCIPLEEAEELKRTHDPLNYSPKDAAQKKLNTIIDARCGDIFERIELHLKKMGKSQLLPAGIIITGGGSGITTIEDVAKTSLKLPARVVLPHLIHASEDDLQHTHWSVAHGLCLLGMDNTYQSDLFQMQTARAKDHVRKFVNWTKQFLP